MVNNNMLFMPYDWRDDPEAMTATIDEPRMEREKRTMEAMVDLFCKAQHGDRNGLCPECEELFEYALARLETCPFSTEKPTCAKCPVHCYKPVMRERIRTIMRYSGPRMLIHHPVLALHHLLDGVKSKK
jgi:hypothetical protein